jgi:uncharacterized iron-regulated membrane protein
VRQKMQARERGGTSASVGDKPRTSNRVVSLAFATSAIVVAVEPVWLWRQHRKAPEQDVLAVEVRRRRERGRRCPTSSIACV